MGIVELHYGDLYVFCEPVRCFVPNSSALSIALACACRTTSTHKLEEIENKCHDGNSMRHLPACLQRRSCAANLYQQLCSYFVPAIV